MRSTDWLFDDEDHRYMGLALDQARAAAHRGEVPVGAVLVRGSELLADAGNERQATADVTAHAEILVLRRSGAKIGDWRLDGSTLYVTLEPCPMCLESCRQARIALVIWGARDPSMGACGSVLDLAEDRRLHPKLAQRGGLRADESTQILKEFFAKRRVSS